MTTESNSAESFRVCVVIINYCTPDLVAGALQSLTGEIDPDRDRVVVVDNCSPDDSLDSLRPLVRRPEFSNWCELIEAPENGGFSYGNNVGIRAVRAQHYLLLNSDAYLLPGALGELLAAVDAHREAGLISPRLQWPDGEAQISCFRFHSPLSELIDACETGPVTRLLARWNVPIPVSDQPSWPQWTSFACIFVRREVCDAIGLMDEDYFLFYEDVDYCRAATRAGFKVLNWPAARVVHLRGGSSEVKSSQASLKRLPAYFYRSRSRYFRKFYTTPGLVLSNLCWNAGYLIALLRQRLGSKTSHVAKSMWRDIWISQKPGAVAGAAKTSVTREST